MFLSALQIAGPLIAVLFLTDVAFGLLNRVAPALNAFQLGFPAKIFLVRDALRAGHHQPAAGRRHPGREGGRRGAEDQRRLRLVGGG